MGGQEIEAPHPAGTNGPFDIPCLYHLQVDQFLRIENGADDKTLKTYPGGYHNLVIDLVKDEVMQDIDSWITRQLATKTRKTESTK